MKKKMEVAMPGFKSSPQPPPAKKVRLLTTGPCDNYTKQHVKLIVLKYFSLPFTLFEPCGAVFIMNSKIHLRKNSSKRVFQNHFALFPCLFTVGFYIGRSINGLVFFFAALAEVQVTVLSVLNLPRQGFPATCQIGQCCVCSPRLIASEILCDSPTYYKQRMNKMSPSRWPCCLETQNAR